MKYLHYTVKGEPRTKKNSMMIAGGGKRCHACGKPAKQWIRQGRANDKWSELAGWQLRTQRRPRRPIDFPVIVCYRYYTKIDYYNTKAKIDVNNLNEAMDDILVNVGILADDNIRVVAGHDGTRVFCDKNNPRVEIYIYRLPDESPEQMAFLKF